MLKQWIRTGWNELTALEQVAVLEGMQRIGRRVARRQFIKSQKKGESLLPASCWDYFLTFGDDPESPAPLRMRAGRCWIRG
jgi:hypothetical protein